MLLFTQAEPSPVLPTPISANKKQLYGKFDAADEYCLLCGQFDICVAVSFGLLIPAFFLESLKYPGLNVHPSLLPAFSGPAPMQRALLSHQNYTGVSLQTLDKKKFDRGRILAQDRQEITESETLDSLCEKLADAGGRLLKNSLDTGLYKPQNYPSFVSPESYSYAAKIKPSDKRIDWNNFTTKQILRRQNTLGPLFANVQAISKENQPILKRVYLPNLQPATTRDESAQPGQFSLKDGKLTVATIDSAVECATPGLEGIGAESATKFINSLQKRTGLLLSQNWPCASLSLNGVSVPSGLMSRGSRTLSRPSASNAVAVLRIPSLMLLAKSKSPVAVFVGSPIKPLPSPLKNPDVPSWLAPSIGAVAIPASPLEMPSTSDVAPVVMPYIGCFGLLRCLKSRRRSWKFLSIVAAVSPLAMEPVNRAKLSLKPKTDFFTKLNPPLASPMPSSCGRSVIMKPWYGS
ncbi:hypothetical protein OGATHE_003392 [Ogataea polymorpha]|uniref:Methionyl-tRNA formyltransferase n=1 Tax=Ogataea polymorpha TaxID=460523 RepID=A0A9P8P3L4_9ASCO|nr:hypothetical protein OGATHE_003392 [Ogataea polymorpha]